MTPLTVFLVDEFVVGFPLSTSLSMNSQLIPMPLRVFIAHLMMNTVMATSVLLLHCPKVHMLPGLVLSEETTGRGWDGSV